MIDLSCVIVVLQLIEYILPGLNVFTGSRDHYVKMYTVGATGEGGKSFAE